MIAAAGYALAGRHVHVVTINDYLARRDAEWMGPVIEAMGLTVGWITAESTSEERRTAYGCDVTYASVNEIGFDVLRDQLVTDVAEGSPGAKAGLRSGDLIVSVDGVEIGDPSEVNYRLATKGIGASAKCDGQVLVSIC